MTIRPTADALPRMLLDLADEAVPIAVLVARLRALDRAEQGRTARIEAEAMAKIQDACAVLREALEPLAVELALFAFRRGLALPQRRRYVRGAHRMVPVCATVVVAATDLAALAAAIDAGQNVAWRGQCLDDGREVWTSEATYGAPEEAFEAALAEGLTRWGPPFGRPTELP